MLGGQHRGNKSRWKAAELKMKCKYFLLTERKKKTNQLQLPFYSAVFREFFFRLFNAWLWSPSTTSTSIWSCCRLYRLSFPTFHDTLGDTLMYSVSTMLIERIKTENIQWKTEFDIICTRDRQTAKLHKSNKTVQINAILYHTIPNEPKDHS